MTAKKRSNAKRPIERRTYRVSITINGTVKAASAEQAQNLVHQTIDSSAPIIIEGVHLSVQETNG